MSTNNIYFTFKGQVGYYDTKSEAIKKGGSVTNVIELTCNSNNRQNVLLNLLINVANTRRDIDFTKLYPFVSEKEIRILEAIKRKHIYTTAYLNRIISDDGVSTYGIWLSNEKHNYCYKSETKLKRGQITDEVIWLKLLELSKRYGFVGTLKTPFPIPPTNLKDLAQWTVKEVECYNYDLPMLSLVEILKGNKSIIPVDFIK